jgi:SNF2 family DNA or RNA helicase
MSSKTSFPSLARLSGYHTDEPGAQTLVLHAVWLAPLSPRETGSIGLWGERAQDQTLDNSPPASLPGAEPVRMHPFALRDADLQSALTRLWKLARPWVRPRATSTHTRLSLWLPTADDAPTPSPELLAAGGVERTGDEIVKTRLLQWSAPARLLDAEAAGSLLAGLPFTSGAEIAGAPRLVFGGDLRFWSAAAALAQEMLVRQWYVPGVVELPRGAQLSYGSTLRRAGPPQPAVGACWYAALAEPEVAPRFETLTEAMPDLARASVAQHPTRATPSATPPARATLEGFIHAVVNARVTHWLARSGVRVRMSSTSIGNRSGGLAYQTTLTRSWLESLSRPAEAMYLPSGGARALLDDLNAWNGASRASDHPALRLCFRLSPPEAPEETRGGASEQPTSDTVDTATGSRLWRLDYHAQAPNDLSLIAPLGGVWRGTTALLPAQSLASAREQALRGLGKAASLFAPIARSLRESKPEMCFLTGAEAYEFLRDAAPQLEKAGFAVQTPPWWKRGPARAIVRGRLRGGETSRAGLMGLDALVGFDYTVALGGEEITRAELERLATLKEPLVRLRGQWVEIQPAQAQAALALLERAPERLTLGEALQTATTGALSNEDGAPFELEEVSADGWIGDLLGRLRGVSSIEEIGQPENFCGELRPYQLRGVSWLNFLTQYGLGACLADDMGLGKTLMLLALLLHLKEAQRFMRPVLLICPTSIVGNWQHEAARFAPYLRVLIHHGAERLGRADAAQFLAEIERHDLVITTYSLAPRDEGPLAKASWGAIVLDEAQNIKNVAAKQSRVVRRLSAPIRIALTGTPVENRLVEFWSIMDFLNPGYLGSYKRFQQRYANRIERRHDTVALTQLQALTQPFVLRRLKSDPAIIQDLPEKIEMREYCALTREQVSLYEAVVRDGLRQLEENPSAMRRRGVILAMLTRLKQVCNHPAHLLDDGSPLPGRSGKLTRLEELVDELLAEGDRALIFTQFAALGARLQPYLAKRFGVETLYLHGGVPRLDRVRMVERFQVEDGPPLFILSLKAGGYGLNLTRANHVIHFDRWWNPAVENQATDRAFRIGQTRNVQVRKFVCSGTLEERIDLMIEQKRALAEQVVGTGENWITELSTEQLRDLFSLRADALAE